jgi:hypothetical protein
MTDVAEDTTQLQNAVRSFLSAVEPEESVAFAVLVYFYSGLILCARVAPALYENYLTICREDVSCSSAQKLHSILRNPKVHYR